MMAVLRMTGRAAASAGVLPADASLAGALPASASLAGALPASASLAGTLPASASLAGTLPAGASLAGALLASALLLLASCGEPPQPQPTAPPERFAQPSGGASSASSFTLPPTLPGTLPAGGVPGYPAYPTYAVPHYTLPALPATTPAAPAATKPKPAPACTSGPTAAQVIALARTAPGIPAGLPMTVAAGPYCQSSWQYTRINTRTGEDPLLVVSTGAPAALKLVEAGQDVCSDKVAASAPAGIRVLACGS